MSQKTRIAILGGGTGSLAAAWALTSLPGAAEKYDITVYQLGWRLGGKGASGRNAETGQRIEEHGLHIWAGFYENAFRLMRECYGALPPGWTPLASWRDAFKRHSAVEVTEWIGERWVHWPIDFPENAAEPGTGGALLRPWDYLQMLLDWMADLLRSANLPPATPVAAAAPGATLAQRLHTRLHNLEHRLEEPFHLGEVLSRDRLAALAMFDLSAFSSRDLLKSARRLAGWLPGDPLRHLASDHQQLFRLVDEAVHRIERRVTAAGEGLDNDLRRLLLLLDLSRAVVKGILGDGVLLAGFEVINGFDWSDWLRRNGARQETLDSALVRGLYCYAFAYEKGEASRTRLEAGTGVHAILRLTLTYKGSLFYEMQGGMGDVVFAPLYKGLRDRGVTFRFFHRVENLGLSADGRTVDRVDLLRQAEPVAGEYDPLVQIKGMPCWPSLPLYDQLVDGEKLAESGVDLESYWAPRVGTPATLVRGRDFDQVVLGLSLGALPHVCPELLRASAPFRTMCEKVQTMQTCSLQLWFDRDAAALGASPVPRVVSSYADDLNTWADMSYLVAREDWPASATPRFLAYLCGPFPDAAAIPPFSDHDFPARELARLIEAAAAWLEKNTGPIWPRATLPGHPNALDYGLLHAPPALSGIQRLAAQYLRVNIDPTERYVLSVPGSSKYRLEAGASGFTNLVLAGDWVRTVFNVGCIEAAVMGGLAAASALSGKEIEILGNC